MTRFSYYDVPGSSILQRSGIADAIMALGRRAQLWAWHWLSELGTPNAWLYTTSADISKEQIKPVEPENARQYLHLMGSGKVGFWAIIELGASSPKVVDMGVEDASAAYLVGSPLVADQLVRERGR